MCHWGGGHVNAWGGVGGLVGSTQHGLISGVGGGHGVPTLDGCQNPCRYGAGREGGAGRESAGNAIRGGALGTWDLVTERGGWSIE